MDAVYSKFDERQIMLNNTLEVYHYKDPYFKAPDFHSHDFYEFYFFIDGCVTYHIEESVYDLVPGDVLIIPPGELHRPVIVEQNSVYERIVLWINRETVIRCIGDNTDFTKLLLERFQSKNHLLHFETDDFKNKCNLLNSMIAFQNSKEPEDRLLQLPYLSILLITLYKSGKNNFSEPSKPENIISKIILYINENIDKDIKLDFLSEQFFISKYHLIRTFKAYTNTTIGQYITSKRITKTKFYLQHGYNLLESSQKSGFNNYSNFYKAFIKETGISPNIYKKLK